MSSEGKTLLVTGAGNGIGRAIAHAFYNDGARVVAVDLAADSLDVLEKELPGIVTVTADVSDPADVTRAVEAAGGPIDVLCNNAGLLDELRLVDEMSFEQWNRVVGVNLNGPFLFCKAALPAMVANGGGIIINMSSICGIRGGRAGAGYTTTKHALIGLTRNIAATYADQKVRAVTICPGSIRFGANAGRAPGSQDSERGHALTVGRDRLQPEPGTPEDIAGIALFLASPAATLMTGIEVVADRGQTLY